MNSTKKSIRLIQLIFLLSFSTSVNSDYSFSAEFVSSLQEFIQDVMECRQIVGMNLVVVKKDEVLLSNGYGIRRLNPENR